MSDLASSNPPSATKKRTWDACAGLHEAEAPLAHLDGRVVFGDDYPEPIRYDAERKKLRYRGFMSHSSYVKLAALCDEREYQTALEQVFVATSPGAISPPWQVPWKGIAVAALAMAVLAGGWYVRSGRLRPVATPQPAENRILTLKVETAGDVAAQVPEAAATRPEGEARRPVER
jgi:hypothetical protein